MEQTNETNTNVTDIEITEADKTKLGTLSPELQKLFEDKLKEASRKAYERAEKRVEERTAAKLKEIEEAEKLKSMSESEKQEAILKQYQAKIAEYEQKELKSQFKIELSESGLPQEYADIIPVNDADKAKEAINFLKNFKASLIEPYEKRTKELEAQLKAAQLRSPAPRATDSSLIQSASPIFADAFNKIKNKK